MNTLLGILFNTRQTFQKIDNEFTDNLNIKTSVIFCVSGIGTGIKATMEDWEHLVEPNFLSFALWLLTSGIIGFVVGRYIVSKVLFKIGQALKGKADIMDVVVVTAYSTIPLLIEAPIALYKVIILKGHLSNFDYGILNGLHLISWGLSIKILFQGLRYFNGYGTMKAVINISPFIVLPMIAYAATLLIR